VRPGEIVRVPLPAPQAVAETTATLHRGDGPLVVLAHGAGSGPDSDVLQAATAALAGIGCATATFAFGYRAAGRRAPDPMPRLLAAWRAALTAVVHATDHHGPVILAGRSMGGRCASLLAAGEDGGAPVRCDGLLLIAYPLRAAAQPPGAERLRTSHWPALAVPVRFVVGDRDPLCPLPLLDQQRALLPDSAVHVVAGADHSLRVRARDGRTRDQVLAQVGRAAVDAVTAMVGGERTPLR
jgi:predicted alpha/beta-hydrolase family hydrolase